ncbi:hypothetical protein GUJ93_ZPchr0009g1210 [Zizania palustris]|uniref:25S rRNA (uridine-N(3))-methyltransferase BMT5-like domain-containing protein n=1 Tax=Zizania palustris TaxID=103762 RepID=A0A8J5UYA1_ZIZPA|nr:hypothetical protein GUJ93_ZPchr0009g1210 [Zizania palustris]
MSLRFRVPLSPCTPEPELHLRSGSAPLPSSDRQFVSRALMAVASLSPEDAKVAPSAAEGEAVVDGKKVEAQGIPVTDRAKDEAPVAEGANAIAAEGEEDEEGVKWLKHYSSVQSILTVGDGDFSFSRALATAFGSGENLVATSLDTIDDLRSKYSKAESNITELKRLGATVLHGVNAKRMKDHTDLKVRRFDRIVFNFPHAGFKGKEDNLHMINSHKELVRGFFRNARHLLRPSGEIHVNHKRGRPYDNWDIEHLAFESSLVMVDNISFRKEDYPGYNQKRGDGGRCDQPFVLGSCCTFMFCIGDFKKLKKVHGNRIDSFSSLGIKIQPDILGTDRWPFHPLPLVPEWPQPHFPPPVSAVHRPITPEPFSLGFAHREQPSFPVNFGAIERAPYFLQQDAIRPMFRMPGGTRALMEQPWYQDRAVVQPEGRYDYCYSAQEYRRRLREEYEMLRQVTPGGTRALLELHLYQDRPVLQPEGRDAYYYSTRDDENLQRGYEMPRQVMPGGDSLGYSAFLQHSLRDSVQKEEELRRIIAWYGSH